MKKAIAVIASLSMSFATQLTTPTYAKEIYVHPFSEFPIKIQAKTTAVAGKYFSVKLSTEKSINGECYSATDLKGFAKFKFTFNGKHKVINILPIDPGAGRISLDCYPASGEKRSATFELYIRR